MALTFHDLIILYKFTCRVIIVLNSLLLDPLELNLDLSISRSRIEVRPSTARQIQQVVHEKARIDHSVNALCCFDPNARRFRFA